MSNYRKRVMVSGGFDPLHLGHINLFVAAKALGTELGVIVNGDEYVGRKHKVLIPQHDRLQVIQRIDCVDFVVTNHDSKGNVSTDLELFHPDIFAVGPDYADRTKLPEWGTCCKLGINVVTMTQLEKDRSSSVLLAEMVKPKWVNPPVTVSVLLCSGDEHSVLVVNRGQEDGKGKLELPGGFLEPSESLEDAAEREVKEEVGTFIHSIQYLCSYKDTYPDGRELVSVYFKARPTLAPAASKECPHLQWVDEVPVGEWFAESDRQALSLFFRRG